MEKFAGNEINVITSLHAKQNSMFSTTRSSNKSMVTHVASRAVFESLKVRQEMKKRARETEERPLQQGQIAVSPWPHPQHQYVKKSFF